MDQAVLNRAVDVQDQTAAHSHQRGVKIADLLIAAAAEFRAEHPAATAGDAAGGLRKAAAYQKLYELWCGRTN
ncbi:MAG: hypothetical protein M3Y91_19375, partial [Actinomycetota bacterium]|nr:hypothetical protein [Actinomycetota bacterium]